MKALILVSIFLTQSLFATTTGQLLESDRNFDIIDLLQDEIQNSYIPYLEDSISSCQKNNCVKDNGDYLELQLSTKNVCLPYTRCGFYNCMEQKYQCKPQGVNYFTDLAFPTCSEYVKNIHQKNYFSKKGIEWIYSVMVCLQKGLIEECEVKGNCEKETPKETCNYITEFTLKFHPGCYINSGVGICNLPFKDKVNIWRTVGKFLTPRERKEAYKVIFHCIKDKF